jgi:hypothetical protein
MILARTPHRRGSGETSPAPRGRIAVDRSDHQGVLVIAKRLSALLAIPLLAIGIAAAPSAPAATPPTTVSYAEPVDSTGHLDTSHYRITDYFGSADCYPGSEVLGDIAYRCFTVRGSYVIDPCFAGFKGAWWEGEQRMYCPQYATSTTVTDITDPYIEDTNQTGVSRVAWAVQLLPGVRCRFYGGMGTLYQGHRLNWECNDPAHTWIIGSLNKTTATWTATAVWYNWRTSAAPHGPHTVRIVHAIYARVPWCEWC